MAKSKVTSKVLNKEPEPVVQEAATAAVASPVMELDIDEREEAGLKIRGKLYPYRFDLPLARMLEHQRSSVRIAELAEGDEDATDEISALNEAAFADALELPEAIRRKITAVEKLRIVQHWLSLMYNEVATNSPLPKASSE